MQRAAGAPVSPNPEPAAPQLGPGQKESSEQRRSLDLRALVARHAVLVALILMAAAFSALRPETFFTVANLESILTTQSVLVVLALGVTIALAAGEFDISFPAVVGFSAGLLAHLCAREDVSPVVALAVTCLAALSVGVTNGIFVVGFGVNSFIATLGVGTLVSGLALAIFGEELIPGVPSALTDWAGYDVAGLALPVYLGFVLVALLWFFLEHTPAGRQLVFTGEGREASRLAGVRVNRIRFLALVASALMAWLAGVILLGQTGAGQATVGNPLVLPALAAAFLGATTVKPGRYNAWGTVIAIYLLAVGTAGLQLLGAQTWVEDVFNGAALLFALTLARQVSREE